MHWTRHCAKLALLLLCGLMSACGQFKHLPVCEECRMIYGRVLARDDADGSGVRPLAGARVSVRMHRPIPGPHWLRALLPTVKTVQIANGVSNEQGEYVFVFKHFNALEGAVIEVLVSGESLAGVHSKAHRVDDPLQHIQLDVLVPP